MNERPLVSVLTPVHDTPIGLFERAMASVKNQTYDPTHIEWLVCVHNMDRAYRDRIAEIAGQTGNARILSVGGAPTPAVPRNIMLDEAKGTYIFFLDSDDELLPDCIEASVRAMEESHADALLFSVTVQDEAGLTSRNMPELILNARSETAQVYERGDPRINSVTMGCAMVLWSHCYRTGFLRDAGIRFDEGAMVASDVSFNLEVAARLSRLCILPGLTGCVYHVRGDSLYQSADDDKRDIGVMDMYDRLADISDAYGFDISEFLWSLMYFSLNRKRLLSPAQYPKLPFFLRRLRRLVRHLRVPFAMPCSGMDEKKLGGVSDTIARFFPEDLFPVPAEGRNRTAPYLRHLYDIVERRISKSELKERVGKAARDDYKLRVRRNTDVKRSLCGIIDESLSPSTAYVDLLGRGCAEGGPSDAQARLIRSYRRVEELGRFDCDREVSCRVTVFALSDDVCALLVTWDDRFIDPGTAKWLWNRVACTE